MAEASLEEFQNALNELPESVQQQIAAQFESQQEPYDFVAVKMELIKFTSELYKHNQACDWETNKIKPKEIKIDQIISGAEKLFSFLIS
tara:strand:+ start:333 stop:599 length:267 start_codon:yes stop_codon:yes gene_type:complete